MWLHDEILSAMFQEKVKNQRWELQNARKRNAELSKNCKQLEEERKLIDERLENSQFKMVTQKNHLNTLLEELKAQKKINMAQAQRLQICNEQLESLQTEIDKAENLKRDSQTELKPISEKLSFKWNVVDCLEKLLVSTRLQTAEQEEIISELRTQEEELRKDVTVMKAIKPSSISTWQEEFLDARLKEADVNLEFEKIRRDLTLLKKEVNVAVEDSKREDEDGSGDFFSIKLNIKDKHQEKLKLEQEHTAAVSGELHAETDRLKMQINELTRILENIKGQIQFNENIKLHLYEVRSSIFQRLYRTSSELEKQIEKNHKTEEKMKLEIERYVTNIEEKNNEIERKLLRIEELQTFIEKSTEENEESLSLSNQTTLTLLEDKVDQLEEKIMELKEQDRN